MDDNDGPFVFPTGGALPTQGLTLREYFMAHAPAEPQPWFVPTMPPRPEALWPNGRSEAEDEYPVNLHEIEAWNSEFQKQRFVQWPAAWADEMMRQR